MNAMLKWLARFCEEHLLAEKWLLADDLRIAQQWKDRLNLAGHSTINLHPKTLPSLTVALAGNFLAAQNLSFIGSATSRMIVQGLLSQLAENGELSYFCDSRGLDGLSELMSRSIRDLRLAEITPNSMRIRSFESDKKGRDVKRVYQAYLDKITADRLVDYPGTLQVLTTGLKDGSIQLPPALLVILPEELELSAAESRMLDSLANRANVLAPSDVETYSDRTARARIASSIESGHVKFDCFSGYGEVNEIRGVLQRILSGANATPLRFDDVEILHTDYQQYVPLFLEMLSTWLTECTSEDTETAAAPPSVDSLPITFAEGLACVYSRPGRALRGWLRWAKYDFVQSKLVQLLREGLLARPDTAETIGYSRLAHALRQIPIGFQADRYLPKIRDAVQSARSRSVKHTQELPRKGAESKIQNRSRDFGLAALEAIESIVSGVIQLAPNPADSALVVLDKARDFLLKWARAENQLDRYAREKLLEDIAGMYSTLQLVGETALDVWQWLEELPLESRILASGPQPGCIHLAPLAAGGTSGRRNIFVVGLDDARFPKRARVEPILLDTERKRLSDSLVTSQQVAEREQQALMRLLHRSLAEAETSVCCSYSCRSMTEDRSLFPSSSLLELFRIAESDPEAHLDDLLSHVGPPVSFASLEPNDHLDLSDVNLASLLSEPSSGKRMRFLEHSYPHFASRRVALDALESPSLSPFDGYVPAAGKDLDPTENGQGISAKHLETYGTCPRRYFFRHGLRISPPDECEMDPEKWLDALQFGRFVHSLFEEFLQHHTENNLMPALKRDLKPLRKLLHSKVKQLQTDCPIPSQDAFERQLEQLEDICEIFLRKEEEYCQSREAYPWVLEASIGLGDKPRTPLDCPDPVPLILSDGHTLSVGGRIDRVDRITSEGSECYAIWDYKSGSDFGFSNEDPFRQGRKLQPFLYVGMLRHRIMATGGKKESVESFGYFFPTSQTNGLRLRWTHGELKRGDEILRLICDSIKKGLFIPTTEADDCKFCDYASVCGDPTIVAADSLRKAVEPSSHRIIKSWKKLRDIDT